MTDDSRMLQTIEWRDEGTEKVIQASNKVRDSVLDATEEINKASDALGGFKDGLSSIPTIPLPSTPLPFDFDTEEVKKASRSIEQASQSTVDLGGATEQLSGILDSVIPGLGGVGEALLQGSIVGAAASAAIAGVNLVLGEMQRQADETRKAAEALAQAETERALAQIDLEQREALVRSGSKEAREKILTDLADYTSQKELLERQGAKNAKLIAEQLKLIDEYSTYRLEAGRGDFTNVKSVQDAQDKINAATAQLNDFNSTAADLATDMIRVTDNLELLRESAERVGITAEEQAAVNRAIAEGTEGAVIGLRQIWEGPKEAMEDARAFGEKILNSLKLAAENTLKEAEEAAAAAKQIAEERAAAEERLLKVNEDLADVEADRGKALADRAIEAQRTAEFDKLNERLKNAQEYDAQRARNAKLAELQQQAQAAETAAQTKFFEDSQKNMARYLEAEKQAEADHSLQRIRALEDLNARLLDLSSQRDVAGFVNARRSGLQDISRGDEDAGIDAQRRRQQYEQSQTELETAFAKERTTRQAQLQERLQQEQEAAQQAITATQRAQKAIADLREQYARQDLAARRMQEDLSYRQTIEVLQRKRMDELRITQGAAAGVVDIALRMRDAIARIGTSVTQSIARNVPSYDVGTPFVPQTQLALLHQGERVMTAADNARYMRGGTQERTPSFVIQNLNVGKVASQADINAAVQSVVDGIASFASNGNM
jgi:DNA repair exonuclease SbcCD ATPase subunit